MIFPKLVALYTVFGVIILNGIWCRDEIFDDDCIKYTLECISEKCYPPKVKRMLVDAPKKNLKHANTDLEKIFRLIKKRDEDHDMLYMG